MAEVERTLFCENCGSTARLIYDTEDVNYEPENCPFCGELVGTHVEEDDDWEELLDDGLDEEDDINWN